MHKQFELVNRRGESLGVFASPEAAMTAVSEIGLRFDRYADAWVGFSDGGVAIFLIVPRAR